MNDAKDLHHALALAVLALTGARAAVDARSTPEQVAQLAALVADGAQLALAIRISDGVAHIEIAALPAEECQRFFEHALLRFDGPAIAALAAPGTVAAIDRGALN